MKIELLVIGDELLDGRRVDSNSAWLGRELSLLGVPPWFKQTVPDDDPEIQAAVSRALERADLIITSGGLGPTSDDLTFESLAKVAGRKIQFHPEIFSEIEERFRKRNLPCPTSNRRQAMLPEGAEVLENEYGTAPAIHLTINGKDIFSLPGVPSELTHLFNQHIRPFLNGRLNGISSNVEQWIYQFSGISESLLEDRINECRLPDEAGISFRLAYTASFPIIETVFSVRSSGLSDHRLLSELRKKLTQRIESGLGEYIYYADHGSLEEKIIEKMRGFKQRLSVAESVTGGLIVDRLIEVPGSSEVVDRAVVAYSNRSKTDLLGVSEKTLQRVGAVSEEAALEMANGIRSVSGTDWAIATTGIAGPDGGTSEKPVGLTYVAWVGPGVEKVLRYQFRWDRNRNRMQAAIEALRGFWRLLEAPKAR